MTVTVILPRPVVALVLALRGCPKFGAVELTLIVSIVTIPTSNKEPQTPGPVTWRVLRISR